MIDYILLATVGAVGASLIGMERLASWRLRACQRRLNREALLASLPANAQDVRELEWEGQDVLAYADTGTGRTQVVGSASLCAAAKAELHAFLAADAQPAPSPYWSQALSA